MINSLFSSFDPITGFFSLNFFLLFLLFTPITLYFKNYNNNRTNLFILNLAKKIKLELSFSIFNKNKKNKPEIFVTIFFMVLFLNIFRLLPYVFTLTAHIFFTFTLVLPF